MLNPYAILGALLVLIASIFGGYRWGYHAADTEWQAKAGKQASAIEAREDTRDTQVEAIATATGAAVAKALAENRGNANERTARISTVPVPADCRAVPAGIVRDLQAGADDVNAALGVGVRSRTARAAAASP